MDVDLRGRAVRSSVLRLGSQVAQVLLGIGSAMILARLLTPEAFGLFAMVISLTAFVSNFQDFGFSMATVQREQVDHRTVSALFWVTLKLNALLALFLAVMAPVLAWFYGDARLTAITLVMATGVFVVALATQHEALLIRRMRFGRLVLIDVGSLLAGAAVAVLAALLGAGYWALVYQFVVTSLARTAALWAVSGWHPALYDTDVRARTPTLRAMLSYGTYLTGSRITTHIARHIDRVLVGYFNGASAIGLYDSAHRWALYPVDQLYNPLRQVAVASLSRVQTDAAAYRAACREALLPFFSIGLPTLAFMFVEARRVILVLLGEQWLAATPLFRLMCVAAFASTVTKVTWWLYLSQGETKRQFRWGLVATPVMVLAVALGVPWGAFGVAAGFTAGTCLLAYPAVAYCLKTSHLGMRDFIAIVARPALASVGAAAGLFVGDDLLTPQGGLVVEVLVKLAAFGVLYVALWIGLPGGKRAAADVSLLIQEVFPRVSKSRANRPRGADTDLVGP